MLPIILFMLLAALPLVSTAQSEWAWRNPLPQGNPLHAVASTATQVLAVGGGGAILSSPDGATWTPRRSGTATALYCIASTGSQWVAGGGNGTLLTSPDGIGWTARNSGTQHDLQSIASTGSQWVAVGAFGTILASPRDPTRVASARDPGAPGISFRITGSRLFATLPRTLSGRDIRAAIYTVTGSRRIEARSDRSMGGVSIPIDALGNGMYFCELRGAGRTIREGFRVSR